MWCNYINLFSYKDISHNNIFSISFKAVLKDVSDNSLSIDSYIVFSISNIGLSKNQSSIFLRYNELAFIISSLKSKVKKFLSQKKINDTIIEEIKIAKNSNHNKPKFLSFKIYNDTDKLNNLYCSIYIYNDSVDYENTPYMVKLSMNHLISLINVLKSIQNSMANLISSAANVISNNIILKEMKRISKNNEKISLEQNNVIIDHTPTNDLTTQKKKNNDKYSSINYNQIYDDTYDFEFYNDKEINI